MLSIETRHEPIRGGSGSASCLAGYQFTTQEPSLSYRAKFFATNWLVREELPEQVSDLALRDMT